MYICTEVVLVQIVTKTIDNMKGFFLIFFFFLCKENVCRSSHTTKFRGGELILNDFAIELLALTEAKKRRVLSE